MRYTPKTQTWKETSRIQSERIGNLQPQVVQVSADNLIAFMRRGGGYGRDEQGHIFRSESNDGGDTWSNAVETEFPNPNSAVELIKLQNGHILLVYNDSMNDRSPLTVAVSTDGAKTFPHRRNIAGGDNSFAYPYGIQAKDGKIHVIFTTNARSTIMHAVFEEAAITGTDIQY
ncbi:MAG: exo-alpha-sialidase [Candidatus Hydrogenedentes bacterium]|nr:exo-alpha-sialidase [Candidatus Hydrogenedentota bacterium]